MSPDSCASQKLFSSACLSHSCYDVRSFISDTGSCCGCWSYLELNAGLLLKPISFLRRLTAQHREVSWDCFRWFSRFCGSCICYLLSCFTLHESWEPVFMIQAQEIFVTLEICGPTSVSLSLSLGHKPVTNSLSPSGSFLISSLFFGAAQWTKDWDTAAVIWTRNVKATAAGSHENESGAALLKTSLFLWLRRS